MTKIGIIKGKYDRDGLWSATKEVPVQGWNLVKENPWKTAMIVAVISLTTACFLSPAYAGFVNTTAKSAYVGMIEGGKGLYAFAAINPVFAGLLAVAIVGAIGTLIYMNYSKASKISRSHTVWQALGHVDQAKQIVQDVYEKDEEGNFVKESDGSFKIDNSKISTCFNNIVEILKLNPEQEHGL